MPRFFNPPTIGAPYSAYSHGVELPPNARTVFFSGQVGNAPDGTIPDDFEGQMRNVFANIEAILADAGMDRGDDIAFGYYGNCLAGVAFGQDCIRGQSAMLELVDEGLFPERVPVMNVEGACATASMALHSAYKDIKSGESDLVLALGVEKTVLPNANNDPEIK